MDVSEGDDERTPFFSINKDNWPLVQFSMGKSPPSKEAFADLHRQFLQLTTSPTGVPATPRSLYLFIDMSKFAAKSMVNSTRFIHDFVRLFKSVRNELQTSLTRTALVVKPNARKFVISVVRLCSPTLPEAYERRVFSCPLQGKRWLREEMIKAHV